MQMDAGLDTGPVFTQRRTPIGPHDDFGSLHDRLAELGAQALLDVLGELASGRACAVPQATEGASYAPKIEKSETRLDWRRPAAELERWVRALRPAPGAAARLGGIELKIWRARVSEGHGAPGSLLERQGALRVACGADALCVEELQPAGGRRMSAEEFLRGRTPAPDARFE